MMKNTIFKIFIFIIFLAQFSLSKSKELYDNDELLLIFVKDQANFEQQYCKAEEDNNRVLLHLYEDNVGKVFWLRENWHCDKIGDQFKEEYERTECHKYRKYLGIVYEYLLREYAGLPAVKPMFYVDKIFSFCTLTDTIDYLANVWQFYFDSKFDEIKRNTLETLFIIYSEPKLFNEEEKELYYEKPKETFQEIVVQMGLQLKWDNEIGKINLLFRQNFDLFLAEMFKKFQIRQSGMAQSANDSSNSPRYNDQMLFQLNIKDQIYRLHGYIFIAFVRGPFYFEQICNELAKGNFLLNAGIPGENIFAAIKEHLAQQNGTYFGLMYLMKKNWNCAEIMEKSEEEQKQKEECQKFGKYLDIFYENLFKIYAKTEMPALSRQFPTFAQIFNKEHFYVVFILDKISKIFFNIERTKENDRNKIENKGYLKLNLSEEDKFRNYKANFGNLTETLRQKFDDKLKTMLKSAREAEKVMSKTNGANKALMKLRESPFYDTVSKPENKAFIAFVKDQPNFEQFCLENEDELVEFLNFLPKDAIFEQLTQKYEAHLGLVYLMRENWHCATRKECQKYKNYLDTFYEYLFNLQNEDDDPLKAIKSQLLIRKVEHFGTLIDVVKYFSSISRKFFASKTIEMKKLKKSPTSSKETLDEIFYSANGSGAINEGRLKKQFDEKMEEFCKRAGEMVQKDEETMKKGEQRSAEFDDKFGTLFDSPFYGTISQCCESD